MYASAKRRGANCTRVIFLFQAEDCIRDYKVTGVQTCALPISLTFEKPDASGRLVANHLHIRHGFLSQVILSQFRVEAVLSNAQAIEFTGDHGEALTTPIQIGRASCRERV